MNNLYLVKIGFLVENLPNSRPLVRENSRWTVYMPDSQREFKMLVAGEDLSELICEVAPLLRIQLNKLSERSTNDLNDWEGLGRLIQRMTPGMALVWLESINEWQIWYPPKMIGKMVDVIGVGRSAYDAIFMALTVTEEVSKEENVRHGFNKSENH